MSMWGCFFPAALRMSNECHMCPHAHFSFAESVWRCVQLELPYKNIPYKNVSISLGAPKWKNFVFHVFSIDSLFTAVMTFLKSLGILYLRASPIGRELPQDFP